MFKVHEEKLIKLYREIGKSTMTVTDFKIFHSIIGATSRQKNQ